MATRESNDRNPDAITGAPGSHPVGTGVGAVGGGAAGAAMGSFAGPVGTAVGAVVGAVAGGLAGKGVAEAVDPTAEDAYWQENYKTRPYYQPGIGYDELAPAYRYGWESRSRMADRSFEQAEPELRQDWDRRRGDSKLSWDKAKLAARDAWSRIDQRRPAGGSAASARIAESAVGREMRDGETRVPVVEEELHVGKREVERGGVRVRTEVQEKPVEEKVQLREEHVHVERRPVDRPATDADIKKAVSGESIELRERSEEAVVQKQARVVEEVVVGKEATQRTETVRDTIRRTDVEVEKMSAGRSFEAHNSAFRTHWQSSFGASGASYEQYEPAYRYGYTLANDQRHQGREWSAIESDARTSWEKTNPGTWDRFKAAVQHAWQSARGR